MQITVIPDAIGKEEAAVLIKNALRQASYREGDPRQEPVLRSLLQSWVEAGCDFSAWRKAQPRLAKDLAGVMDRWHASFWPDSASAVPILSDAQRVGTEGRIDDRLSGLSAFAWFLFIAAPHFEVGVCDRCHEFYWNRWGHMNKRFCGRKCTQLQTAAEGQRKRVAREREEKKKRLRLAIREFVDRAPAGVNWREWVSRHAGVSKSFLTRTLRRGEQGDREGLTLTKRQRQFLERGNRQ